MKIISTGSAVPQLEVTNDMLSQIMDTNDEWISSRTGIRSRRVLSTESLSELALSAAKRCIENSKIDPSEIDYILCHNVFSDVTIPSLAAYLTKDLGVTCPTIDLNAACAGFIYSLDYADALFKAGKAKNVLIICAEQTSHFVDWDRREVCVLFGDAAAAAMVTASDDECYFNMGTSYTSALHCSATYNDTPFKKGCQAYPYLTMNGRDVFKLAVLNCSKDIHTVLDKANMEPTDISYFLLHQANMRIVDAIKKDMSLSDDKVPHNIEKYGNTSSASVPLLLDEMNQQGKLKRGDVLVMCAFGAGFTSGACLIKW